MSSSARKNIFSSFAAVFGLLVLSSCGSGAANGLGAFGSASAGNCMSVTGMLTFSAQNTQIALPNYGAGQIIAQAGQVLMGGGAGGVNFAGVSPIDGQIGLAIPNINNGVNGINNPIYSNNQYQGNTVTGYIQLSSTAQNDIFTKVMTGQAGIGTMNMPSCTYPGYNGTPYNNFGGGGFYNPAQCIQNTSQICVSTMQIQGNLIYGATNGFTGYVGLYLNGSTTGPAVVSFVAPNTF